MLCPGERLDASDPTFIDSLNRLGMHTAQAEPGDLALSRGSANIFMPPFEDDGYNEVGDEDGGGLYNESEIPDPLILTIDDNRVLVYVHVNGVHQLPTSFCKCPATASEEIQLLRMGLFPSTSTTPQMAFTFQLLDDYLLDNLECKTSALHYFSKLQRMTCKAFPQLVKASARLIGRFHHLRYFRTDIASCYMPADSGGLSRNINGLALDINLTPQRSVNWVSSVLPVLSPVLIFPAIGRRMKNSGRIAGDLFSMETFPVITRLSATPPTMFG